VDELALGFCRELDREAWGLLRGMIETGTNAPPASSAGRLFDAVAALAGVQKVCSYEGQAAIRLEACAEATDRVYPFEVTDRDGTLVMDPLPAIRCIVEDLQRGQSAGRVSGAFHNTFVQMLADAARETAHSSGLSHVALSGGTFQNEWVLTGLCRALRESDLEPVVHEQIPCNDGGLSLGQAVVAGERLR
jgi:hydrogenase maturation protein HypF